MLKKSILAFISLAFFLIPRTGNCLDTTENNEGPFDTINIGLRFSFNVGHNAFHEFWEPGIGAGGFIALPFYFGDIRIGTDTFSFEPISEKTTEFSDWHFFLGWRKRFPLASWMTWEIGSNPGFHYMTFDDELERGLRSETEFGIDVNSGFSFSLGGKWSVDLLADHQVIFTRKTINLTYVSIGASVKLNTPEWLVEILR